MVAPAPVLDRVFQAFSDPTRRAVIERLGRGPASVMELAAPFDMALPSFVRHLRMLEDAELVRSRKAGRVRTYWLVPDHAAEAEHWLAAQRRQWQRRLDQLDRYAAFLERQEKTDDDRA